MKFKIRFAEQIVGVFIVLSLASLIFVIIALGRSQRWFAKDVPFKTILPTAGGLSKNMAVQYKGFAIGNVKSFNLNDDDNVEVTFTINEEYADRVKQGSLVEMMISPIGLGNQFFFHSGKGEMLEEGSLIPMVGSAQARELIRQGLADEPHYDDSISVLMSKALAVLDDLNLTLSQVNEALGPGTDQTEIGRLIGSLGKTLAGVEPLPDSLEKILEGLQADLTPLLANITDITNELKDPGGLLYSVLDTDKDIYPSLVKSLNSISEILDNLDKVVNFIPGQLPQLSSMIMDLSVTLRTAEDVLVALTNNPLLKKGVPAKPDTQGGGTGPRDIRF